MSTTFAHLGVPERICSALARQGITEPFEIQAATIAQVVSIPEESPAFVLWGFVILAVWIASAWAAFALAFKRLHDIGLPGILAFGLLIPAVSIIAFLLLAFLPGSPDTNRHGPPPFPRA